jgi:hypothetical protein
VSDSPNVRHLREKAERADEATAALAAAKRENGVLKAGINLESPLGKFFVESYNGDPADVEGLKAKAAELGIPLISKGVETPEAAVVEETYEPTGTAERTALQDGSPADTGENRDPRQLSKDLFDRRVAEGATQEDAAVESLNVIAQAAMRGDPRVIVK